MMVLKNIQSLTLIRSHVIKLTSQLSVSRQWSSFLESPSVF